MSVSLRARVGRVVRRRSLHPLLLGLARERDARRSERALRNAARHGRPVVVGPFVGEVGFELLYWIPFVRRLLHEHGIGRERVTAFSRGGASAWYEDIAAGSLEILDLVEPERLRMELEARRAEAGHTKPVRISALDRELLADFAPAAVLHPVLMYTRLRYVWDGLQPLSDLEGLLEHALLPASNSPGDLPKRYLFLRPYFNECFPDTEENHRFLDHLADGIAETNEVVLASPSPGLDDHADWDAGERSGIHRVELEPRTNLAVQTALVAGAQALVTTHGGLSYLGPSLGVPTVTFRSSDDFNPVHFQALRASFPGADYREMRVGEELPLGRLVPLRT